MSENERTETDDSLVEDFRQIKELDPAPRLSGVAKAAIVAAAEQKNRAVFPNWMWKLSERFSGGLEVLFKPGAAGALACAGVIGLLSGGVLPNSPFSPNSNMSTISTASTLSTNSTGLSPEDELASIYEFAMSYSDIYNDISVGGETR